MAEEKKKDFFVSYNKHDKAWAEWIAWELEAAGYTTIIQAWDFGAANDFVIQMQKAAVESERTLGVLSPDSITAPFVQKEWAAALAADPVGEKRKLVLARVRDVKLEGLYQSLIYIDLLGLAPDDAKERLLRGVKLERNKPSAAPPFPGTVQPAPSGGPAAPSKLKTPSYFPGATTPIFICAATEDLAHAMTLRKHLAVSERNGVLRTWHQGDIQPGMRVKEQLDAHFTEARIVAMLITKDFLASDECVDLMSRARQDSSKRTIPVLVGHSLISETEFGGTAPLPQDGLPIAGRRDPESAWVLVADALTRLAKSVK